MEYPWWDLDGCELSAALHGILTPFRLTDHGYEDWESLERGAPHVAYAWVVERRLDNLHEAIISLRTIVQMCGVDRFPIGSSVLPIDRYQWIRALLDLALFRVTAIRDCTYFLVSATFELGLHDLEVNLRNMRRREATIGKDVIDCLSKIASLGQDFRNERNARAHQGFQRALGDGEHSSSFFQIASQFEADGIDPIEAFKHEGYHLIDEYDEQIRDIHETYFRDAEALLAEALVLQELLLEPFFSRYETMKTT